MSHPIPHLLHVFSTFAVGGPQVRTAAIINALGQDFRHTILPMDGRREALGHVQIPVSCLDPLAWRHPLKRLVEFRSLFRRLDPTLVLTYNWGAIEAVLAAATSRLSVVHTEDGFGPEEAVSLLSRRIWTRRLLLRHARTVVPSRTLERIALHQYSIPRSRLDYIPNGVDVDRFHPGRAHRTRARLGVPETDLVFGTVGALREEKNFGFLLRAFAAASLESSRLVLVGDGPCRVDLERLAVELGLRGGVIFAGAMTDPAEYYRAFDVFVMSSVTEQMPFALLEAMATGLPAICTNVGDTSALLGCETPPEVIPQHTESVYVEALRQMAADAKVRRLAGAKNRTRCAAEYALENMIARYRLLYREALAK